MPATLEKPAAPPETEPLRRVGRLVRAARSSAWPDRCVVCNEPANGFRLKRHYRWHHPAYFLIILLPGLLVYALVAIAVTKKAVARVGVCRRHLRRRRLFIAFGWLGALTSLPLAFAVSELLGDPQGEGALALGLLGGLGTFAAPVIGLLGSRIGVPRRIDHDHAWLLLGRRFTESVDAEVF